MATLVPRPGSPLLLNLGALIAFHTICGHNVNAEEEERGGGGGVNLCLAAEIKSFAKRGGTNKLS